MAKEVKNYNEVERDILEAVNAIANPVVQTLSPKGGNVMFKDAQGNTVISNDGITIARAITLGDPLKDSIIETIRETSLRTNSEAGDGTTTGILLASTLVKEGIRMRNEGHNPMDISRHLREASGAIVERLEKQKLTIKDEHDKFNIAYISANNDGELAQNVVKAVNAVGTEGMVFIEVNAKQEDEVKEEIGFIIDSGMYRPELRTQGMVASYENVPVLVTDKRLYYKEEAETILTTVYQQGFDRVVIVARDFAGECLSTLLATHTQNKFKILLVKDNSSTDDNTDTLDDLAAYLNTNVVRDKEGSIVHKLGFDRFGIAKRVFADRVKTIIGRDNEDNDVVNELINVLRKKFEDEPNDKTLEKRIASLTSGMVTIRVGGATETQVREKIYRYEDAVNALRTAIKHGYLPGGGIALLNAYNDSDYEPEYRQMFKKMCQSSVVQIAKNCEKDPQYVLSCIKDFQEDENDSTFGFNAVDSSYDSMINAGIIDPFLVTKLAVENSLSAAANILSVNYYIVTKKEDDKKD